MLKYLERSFFMRKTAFILSLIFLIVASSGVIGCGDKKPNRSVYNIVCELDGDVLKGTETVEFFNHGDNALSALKFNLFGNAFREGAKYSPVSTQYLSKAYPNGINYGNMTINGVSSGDDELEFSVCGEDENILEVTLLEQLFPDERVKIVIEYELNLADVVARTGVNANTVNLGNFYPIACALDGEGFYECLYYANGDPFYSDCADYNVTLTADRKYVVASSGKKISETVDGTLTTGTYSIENARSFAFVLSEKFKVLTDSSTGTKINYYYYNDGAPEKSLEFAVRSLSTFNDSFGRYPYENYSVVQTEFVQGGMEYPALVMISDDLTGTAYGEVIVHETAHQWWQTTVGNNEIKYGFLDEGLAEYSVVTFFEKYPEYGMTRENMVESATTTYRVYCSVYDKIFGKVDTSMLRSLGEYKGEYEYVNIAYIKPCIMYDTLRESIGDKKFFGALKKYYEKYMFKNAVPDDLIGAFEKSGADTNGFFQSFFEGKVII